MRFPCASAAISFNAAGEAAAPVALIAQSGAFAIVEERAFVPNGDGVDALVGFSEFPEAVGVHVDAEGAAVQLRCAQLDQFQQALVEAERVDVLFEAEDGLVGLGRNLFHVNSR